MMCVPYAMPIFIFLAKPIAVIGSAVVVFYKFGNTGLLFTHVNAPYADERLPCWFLVRLHQGAAICLMLRMQDLPFLLKRLLRDVMDPQRSLPLVIRARVYLAMLVSAIYVISPVDIIPEALLGIFGLLDDLIIVFICFLHVAALYRAVLVTRHGGA
ncbi:UNVERIFIED_CONTAM: E3 ubiquitin-protein ligase [Sesamum angustifolium]|uniref:E3 ubiquitin-protein ligase n=1 Tax=Sesamum angustifolium TaxID=2727405 RepID=A0AAW2L499_9LAMI